MKLNAIYFHVLYCACSICLIQNVYFYFSNSKEYICCFLEKLPIVRSASLIPIATLFFLHSMYFLAICWFVECTRSCVAYSWKYNVMKTGIFIQRIIKIIQLKRIKLKMCHTLILTCKGIHWHLESSLVQNSISEDFGFRQTIKYRSEQPKFISWDCLKYRVVMKCQFLNLESM